MTPADTLNLIRQRLEHHSEPFAAIEELSPRSLPDAIHWARRRPLWDEFRGQFPDQVIGIAAVISRRAMEEYRLEFGADGRVHERRAKGRAPTPEPIAFPMEVHGQELRVEYTQGCFPGFVESDHFYFTSPDPGIPHPLSWTGYLSHFAAHDEVEACGGHEAFAARLAEALGGKFDKKPPSMSVATTAVKVSESVAPPEEPTPGVVAEEIKEKQPARQGTLF